MATSEIVHILMFGMRSSADPAAVQDVLPPNPRAPQTASAQLTPVSQFCNRLLDLKRQCTHPATQQPYITSITGGRDNSPEGHQRGITHAFVVIFANEEDRDYYVKEDPAHQAFIKEIPQELVETLQVVDFAPAKFT